jgi:hypothetical protein
MALKAPVKTTKVLKFGPRVNTEDNPERGLLVGFAIMVPFYLLIASLIAAFKRF